MERLEEISINKKLSERKRDSSELLKISSLNCRSLKKHYPDISSDDLLLESDMICLQETWLDENTIIEDLMIPSYNLHLNSHGKGKGIAIYFNKNVLRHEQDINDENMQLSKFNSPSIDIVVIYRSQNGNHEDLVKNLKSLRSRKGPQMIIGDFNFCYHENNSTLKYLHNNNFNQLIQEPTHIEGNLLDQAHVRDVKRKFKYLVEVQSKYYSDHKGLSIVIEKGLYYHLDYFMANFIIFSSQLM